MITHEAFSTGWMTCVKNSINGTYYYYSGDLISNPVFSTKQLCYWASNLTSLQPWSHNLKELQRSMACEKVFSIEPDI